jgi:N-methylhydantoinase A/oxoprolinase/acetone carboxylase beta subunit
MDMGGTSLDVAILNGAPPRAGVTPRVAGIPLALSMIETDSIGAGGGSIARLNGTRLEVGPQSAGSAPGPACYDKGGLEPTVTDANLVLGFIDPDRFLGGRMRLNRRRAEDAFTRRLARAMDQPLEAAAAAVRDTVDAAMAAQIASRFAARGLAPDGFSLFAFGGGGPLHGCAIAQRLGIERVVGFAFGSVFSAFGSSTIDVPDAPAGVPRWMPSAAAESPHRAEAGASRGVRWRAAELEPTPIYDYAGLQPGAELDGPAIVQAEDTSYAIPPEWRARIDAWRNVVMTRR